jgi:hypothetical protein
LGGRARKSCVTTGKALSITPPLLMILSSSQSLENSNFQIIFTTIVIIITIVAITEEYGPVILQDKIII